MSEHKYRAWHKTERKMYEDVVIFHDTAYEYECISTPGVGIESEWITPIATQASEIVIMQWTGLADKQDRDIYEGDIIHRPDIGIPMLVRWNEENAGFDLAMKDPKNFNAVTLWYTQATRTDYGVIGNIHEHPELLERNQ